MLPPSSAYGLAVGCDPRGTIAQVYYDDLGLDETLVGASLLRQVEASCMGKAMRLLSAALSEEPAVGWEMTLPLQGRMVPLSFSAVAHGQAMLVLATPGPAGIEPLLRRLTDAPPALVAAMRQAVDGNEDIRQANTAMSLSVFDELTRLNNELANTQRELTKKNMELERLNAEKNRFLGMAAHDLRNPLATIVAYAQFLFGQTRDVLDEEQREFLQIIRRTGDFMVHLVNDFLDISSIEAGELKLNRKWLDPAAMVQQNAKVNQVLVAKKGITLTCTCAPDLPLLWLDGHKIEQVLNNLISNAAKFSPPDSTIRVTAQAEGEQVAVAVADEGPGIPDVELDGLFQPFHTTSVKSTGGEKSTGLGLTIVKKIIEGHGGQIGVTSIVGVGTTFTFTLPVPPEASAQETHAAQQEAAAAALSLKGLQVLIVEDNPSFQRVVQRLVEAFGCRAEVVGDGEAALRALARQTYPVILMDTNLPGMDGPTIVRQIRATASTVQPYIISMSGTLLGQDQALPAGMNAILGKPFRRKDLAACLKAAQAHFREYPSG